MAKNISAKILRTLSDHAVIEVSYGKTPVGTVRCDKVELGCYQSDADDIDSVAMLIIDHADKSELEDLEFIFISDMVGDAVEEVLPY